MNEKANFEYDELSFSEFKTNGDFTKPYVQKTNNDDEMICSTPRQSVNVEDIYEEKIDEDDYSCDLLRSSKIDLTNNDEHSDNTLDSLVESLNFNKRNNRSVLSENKNCKEILSARSTPATTKRFLLQLPTNATTTSSSYYYKAPINQMQNIIENLRKNLNKTPTNPKTRQNRQSPTGFNLSDEFGESNFSAEDDRTGKANDENQLITQELEKEVLKRQHCEKQINDLNQKHLKLEQNIAVLKASDHKKEILIQKLDKSLSKVKIDYDALHLAIWKYIHV
jgi:hypothetical protein